MGANPPRARRWSDMEIGIPPFRTTDDTSQPAAYGIPVAKQLC